MATPDQSKLLVLLGTETEDNVFNKLNNLTLNKIFSEVTDDYNAKNRIIASEDAYRIVTTTNWYPRNFLLKFPPSKNRNINMMPFKLFDVENTLPADLYDYIKIIYKCLIIKSRYEHPDKKIGYLTIHECDVEANTSQRRPGLHIERPCLKVDSQIFKQGSEEYASLAWGLGYLYKDYPQDGIYIASNVDDSTAVYSALVNEPEKVTDKHGSIEHLKHRLDHLKSYNLKANELCWITDRTPHESLPVTKPVHRQFFRLVVGPISVWYSKHNTPNPLGILPDAPISDINKFDL
jgi:hypothetical protein